MVSNARKWIYAVPLLAALALVILLGKPSVTVVSSDELAPPVLVIDAGHGGADGGAVAADGTQEADINLDIALRLRAIAALCGTETRMTRESADIDYPPEAESIAQRKLADQRARLALIHETPGVLLLSIHQNFFSAAGPNGPQVFYGTEPGGEELAELIQTNLNAQLAPQNRRLAAPISDDIYLMKNAGCRAVLVECGFLSNPDELAQLQNGQYRLRLAALLFGSYLQYTRGVVT